VNIYVLTLSTGSTQISGHSALFVWQAVASATADGQMMISSLNFINKCLLKVTKKIRGGRGFSFSGTRTNQSKDGHAT
jgi:hypothetical protein